MVDVVTRASKGAPLTWAEMDANLENLAANTIAGITPAGQSLITAADAAAQLALLGVGRTSLITLSGSNVDLKTDIPSTARRVTVMFSGLSTNGTTVPLVQIGDAGGIEATGYSGSVMGVAAASYSAAALSTGVAIVTTMTAAITTNGKITFDLMDAATNLWSFEGLIGRTDGAVLYAVQGNKALSQPLTSVRLTAGANSFDAGAASLAWE